MKLLIVTHFFESHRGGIEIVAGQIAREIARLGHDTVWLATDASPPSPNFGGISVAVPASNVIERRLGVPFPLPTIRAARQIWQQARLADAVLMHDALYLTTVIAFLAARRFGKPAIIVQHIGTVPYRNPLLRALMTVGNSIVARPLLARATRVVFISTLPARYFASIRFAAPPEMIFNGVDTGLFHPPVDAPQRTAERERLGLPKDRPVLLFVGRFVEKKGLTVLAHMARLRPEVHWAFAGWGPLDPSGWGLTNVGVFTNLAGTSLAPLYQASDALVLPSTGEGFPLVVQEALACGLPVICGADTAVADVAATPLLTGIDVDLHEPERTAVKFCAAVDTALTTTTPREAAADIRHRFAVDHYAWGAAARRYVDLIQSILPRPSTAPSHGESLVPEPARPLRKPTP